MDLRDYLVVLRKYWRSIVSVTLVGLLAAGAFSLLTKPTYTAETAIFLSVQGGDTADDLNQGATYAANQVRSYAQVVTTPTVLQPVIDKLALDTTPSKLAEKVTATIPLNTAIVEITVVDQSAQLTAEIGQAISEQLVSTVESLSPVDSNGRQTVVATIVTPAAVPTEWTSPRVSLNLGLGLLAGLAIGLAQALLRNVLDLRIRTELDVARATEHPVIAKVPFDPDASAHPLVMGSEPHSQRAEAYRRLRTNLQFLDVASAGGLDSIVVTSSILGEGKSTTAINLASTLAEAGERVLLIDADLRHPQVAQYLDIEDSVGLTSVLIGRASLEDVVQQSPQSGLYVLATGQLPPNPAELLASDAMRTLVTTATQRYDFVLVDAPPLLPVTDAAILATITKGALVIVGASSVTVPELRDSLVSLRQVGGSTLGLVMNKVRRSDVGSYYYQHRQPDEVSEPDPAKPTAAEVAR